MWRGNSQSADLPHPARSALEEDRYDTHKVGQGLRDTFSRVSGRFHDLRKHPFIRNASVAIGGAATAQFLTIAFSPLVTRLYGPEAFGAVGVFTATVLIIGSLADLMYGTAIVLPPSEAEARSLLKLSAIICLGISFISLLGFRHFPQRGCSRHRVHCLA